MGVNEELKEMTLIGHTKIKEESFAPTLLEKEQTGENQRNLSLGQGDSTKLNRNPKNPFYRGDLETTRPIWPLAERKANCH